MSKELGGYFNEERSEEMANASEVESNGSGPVLFPGTFRMRVATKKFEAKSGNIITSPELKPTKNKSLGLNFILETVGDVGEVEAGSSVFTNITVSPATNATKEKVKNTMKFAKPRLAALLGPKKMAEFKYDEQWFIDNLTADFELKEGSDKDYVVKTGHSMNHDVMVTLKVGVYNDEPTLNVSSMHMAEDDEESSISGKSIEEEGDAFAAGEEDGADDGAAIDALGDKAVDGVETPEEF